jgi:hypothetical protein
MTLTDKHTAAEIVAANTAATKYPALTLEEIEGTGAFDGRGILDQCVLASVWEPETVYQIGQLIIPTEDKETGRWYVLLGGSDLTNGTGTTEPIWPQWMYGYVSDNGLLWQDRGSAAYALWDLRQAEHEVYKRKLAMVQGNYNVGLDGRDKLDRQGVVENLRDMVERTAPFVAA